tara:strand:- start:1850 stop:2305 length:456 start_codon:yes stop_codon:yes gene_type:complete
MQNIALNKKAKYDYTIGDKYEAGIVLTGSEVKSLRLNNSSIKEAYISEKNNELWLFNCHIKKYSSSNIDNYDPLKVRKILLKKKEKNKIIGSIKRNGMTIVPLSMYFNNRGFAKISIGLAKGKKNYDKRETIKSREWGINKQRLQKIKKSL